VVIVALRSLGYVHPPSISRPICAFGGIDDLCFGSYTNILYPGTLLTGRFLPFALANTLALPKMKNLFNVPMAALAVQTVSKIELCEHFLLRSRSW
jgi:hypothetical protein